MSVRLRSHSRLALRRAWVSGALDEMTYGEAVALMDELGVQDGAVEVLDGDEWVVDVQGWLDRMPVRYSEATRHRFASHAVRFYESVRLEGRTLAEVDEDLLRGWATRRQRGRAAATWAQEELALTSLFEWLASADNPRRRFERSPWPVWRSGSRVTSQLAARRSTLARRVRMLDSVEWAWFRNVGLAGGGAGPGTLAPRYPQRDTVLGDLLVTTGMRVNEARCLLIEEVPQPSAAQRLRPWPDTMLFAGGARAKTRGGLVPFLPEVGDRLWAWWESSVRQEIVEAAQETLRRQLRGGLLFVVEQVSADREMLTFAGRWLGREVSWTADTLPAAPGAAAVRVSGSRVEPLTLWQTDANGGGPMSDTALRQVFAEATARVAAMPGHPFGPDMLRWRRQPDGSRRVTGGVHPHMARHTAAVNWLVELTAEVQRRGRGGAVVAHPFLPSAGPFDPLFYVRRWLRHVDTETTLQYQTWVHRHDWPADRALGAGVRELVADRQVSA